MESDEQLIKWSKQEEDFFNGLIPLEDPLADDTKRAQQQLPPVTVLFDGIEYQGYPMRFGNIAKVKIYVRDHYTFFEFSWEAIARSAYYNEVLLG